MTRHQPPALLCATVALAAAALQPTIARAQTEPIRFAWLRGNGASACARGEQIADQVVDRLGRNPFAPDALRIIEAFVTRGATGWHAVLSIRDPGGIRGRHPRA